MASAILFSRDQLLTNLKTALEKLNVARNRKESFSFLLNTQLEKQSELEQELEKAREAPAWVPEEPVYENGQQVFKDPSIIDLISFARGIPLRSPIDFFEEQLSLTRNLIAETTQNVQVAELVLATAQARYDTAKRALEALAAENEPCDPDH